MKNEVVKLLQKKKKNVLDMWMNFQIADTSLREDLMTNEDLRTQSEELVNLFIDNLNDETINDPENSDFEPLIDMLTGISMSRAKQGYTSRETGNFVFSLKKAILSFLQQEIRDPQELYDHSLKINNLIDYFGVSTFETFIKGREEVILRQTDEITEISTPVTQIWDGILALPIIGTLDSSRTQVVMENLLQKIVETGSSIAILDISGVPAVDSLVSQHLIITVNATRLMGAECIISGIRPEIAQTIVHLGIDLSNIITKATLANALKAAFAIQQLQVVKKQTVKVQAEQ